MTDLQKIFVPVWAQFVNFARKRPFSRAQRVVRCQPVDRSLLVTVFQAVSQLFLLVYFIEELTNEKAIVGHVTRDIKDRVSPLGLCTLPTAKWSSPGKFLSRTVVLMECP